MCRNCVSPALSPDDRPAAGPEVVNIGRRVALGGFAGALLAFAGPSLGQSISPARTTVSPEGLIRTVLESYVDEQGDEFFLLLDTFPAGIVIPPHHHPTTGLNYVLEGVAESQYQGEPLRRLVAGDTFQDHAQIPHLIFRNPDPVNPIKILICYKVKKGQPFLIIP